MDNFRVKQFDDWVPINGMTAIYLIEFDNGKVYVGQTTQTLKHRYGQHYRNIQNDRVFLVDVAIHKHKHTISLLAIVTNEEADKYEREYIQKYQSAQRDKGYNLTEGGKDYVVAKVADSRKKPIRCRETGKVYESLTAACKDTGATIGKINYCALGLADTTGGYTWEYVGEEVYREFNIFSRAVTKALNAEKTREKYLDQWREQGRRTSRYNIGKHHSEETKKKIGVAQKGKCISDETKRKISESVKKYYANN